MEYNLETPEEELIKLCQKLPVSSPNNESILLLDYCLGLLQLKQQKKLLDEQNKFNEKLLRWNKWLVYATWVLAIATIILVLVVK